MTKLTWVGHAFIAEDGYGRFATHIIRELTRLGVGVSPTLVGMLSAPGFIQRLAGVDTTGSLAIQCMPANDMKPMPNRVWGFSMYESSLLPSGWAEKANRACERMIVPCEDNAEMFKRSGVRVPIHVIHGGTSPEEFPIFPYVPRPDGSFAFLALGDRGSRKGIEQVWSAFYTHFPVEKFPNVKLVVKTRHTGLMNGVPITFKDPRISVWREDLPSMADVFSAVDCFVFPSLYEGWGMPPREAVMMGLPTIVSNHTGLAVGNEHWATRSINTFKRQKTTYSEGEWFVPDVDEVGTAMLDIYNNYTSAREKALKGAQWLRDNQTWVHTAQALVKLIGEFS